MPFLSVYLQVLPLIISVMLILWIISIVIKNVSIVDIFWGTGFVITCLFYFIKCQPHTARNTLLMILVAIWGLRLSVYLFWRNAGKGEDYRYREFRKKYGENRYWWISFFQTFLLQGLLMWLISAPLLGAQYTGSEKPFGVFDFAAIIFWLIGFSFEAGGDIQLARFRSDTSNKGKVLDKGFWKYTRHPNYFGDTAVWWSYALFCIAAGSYWPVVGSLLMTLLIIKVSGVALLEKTLKESKPEYREYIRKTSSFFPWPPRK
jgi:steroid 5-alpha reductase family enzyme